MTKLADMAAGIGVALSPEAAERFEALTALLVEANAVMNLTAITDPDEIALKHHLDSLSLLAAYPFPRGARVVDVGTGAGYPGLALKIARPDLELTLLDATGKKLRYIDGAIAKLGLSGARTAHARAEEAGRDPALREKYDVAAARAVARLPVLAEWCLPFVRPGGVFLAMKGDTAAAEAADAKRAAALLGGRLGAVRPVRLPGLPERYVVAVEKTAHTPPQYPRRGALIAQKPL